MTDRGPADHAWLFLKVTLVTLLAPGTVVVLVPALLLGVSLDAVDVWSSSMLGLIPIVLGCALYFRCAYDFAAAGRGTPAPFDPPRELVLRGPYRFSRNPMYVGLLSVLLGETLLFRSPQVLWYTLLVAAVFHAVVLAYEEPTLRRQFGERHGRYREAVPRWIPRWSGLKTIVGLTFQRAGVLVLTAGVVAHVIRLTVGLPITETPDSIHAFLVVVPGYAVFGCLLFVRSVSLPGATAKSIYGLIVLLLSITAALHLYSIVASNSAWLGVFPMWYSVLAAVVYGGFAYFLGTRTVADPEGSVAGV